MIDTTLYTRARISAGRRVAMYNVIRDTYDCTIFLSHAHYPQLHDFVRKG